MSRIIIDIQADIPHALAMELVRQVVDDGKISTAGGVDHYCWCTSFATLRGAMRVITRRKKNGQESDSFIIERDLISKSTLTHP